MCIKCSFDDQIISTYIEINAATTNIDVVPYNTNPESIWVFNVKLKTAVPNCDINKGIIASVAPYTANTRPSSSGSTTLAATDLATAAGTTRNIPKTDDAHNNQLYIKINDR